jgi:PAS domain S-box-containing protein
MFQVPESIEVVQMTEYPVESSAEVVVDLNEKKTIRVLHVDDEDSLLKVAKQCLEMQGSFQVDTASSADEAIEKMKKEKYDIILSDYQMPGKNGLEFLKELRTNGNRTPFVMFTGKGREEIVIKALNLGADHYVNKNGDPETVYFELTHCLHSAVKKRAVEAKAAETAQRLQTINQNAAEGISYVNPEENFVYVNHAFADILGCKEDQLVGMNMRRFVDEEGWSKIKSETERRRKGKAGRYDLVFHRTDGTTRNVQISGSPLFDSDGGFAGTVSIVLDITDRKKVEQRLREPEDMLASIFDAAADGIAYVDTSGKTIAANRRLVEMLGHTLDDTIGGNFLKHDRIDPKDLPRVSKAMEEAVTTAEPARNFEVTLIRKDGSRIPTEINTGIVKKDGKVAGIIAAVRDVTERKKKEIALRESEEKYKDLFESAMDVILTLDLKGNVTAVNSSILRFGYKKEDLVGKSILDFVSKEHWPTIMRDFSQVIQGEPAKNETEIVVPTGKILVEYHARAILKESNVLECK